MTLQTQHTANAPATLTDEQRRRVADALENAQSENTRRNYAGQYRKFRAWCERGIITHLVRLKTALFQIMCSRHKRSVNPV